MTKGLCQLCRFFHPSPPLLLNNVKKNCKIGTVGHPVYCSCLINQEKNFGMIIRTRMEGGGSLTFPSFFQFDVVINFQNSVQSFGRGTYPISSPLSPALNWLRRAMLRRSNERSPIRPRTDPRSEVTIPSSANGDSQVHAQTTPSSSAKVLGLKGDKKAKLQPFIDISILAPLNSKNEKNYWLS